MKDSDRALSQRQRAFIDTLLGGPPDVRGNAMAAAREAGYSTKNTGIGARLLKVPAVAAEIQRRYAAVGVTRDSVLRETVAVAFSRMDAYVTWGPDGVTLKASGGLSQEAVAAVAEVSERATEGGTSRHVRFKLHDKVSALRDLARHLGLFTAGGGTGEGTGGPVGARGHHDERGAPGRLPRGGGTASTNGTRGSPPWGNGRSLTRPACRPLRPRLRRRQKPHVRFWRGTREAPAGALPRAAGDP